MSDMSPGVTAGAPPSLAGQSGIAASGAAVANVLVVLALSFGLWFALLHPNGVLKLYTPMYGFSLVAMLVAVIGIMAFVAEGWPLHASSLPRPARGVLLTAAAVVLTMFVVYGVFWGFLGRYGVTYFSPRAIIAAGGVGAELFNARENASTAIVYFATALVWWSVAVPVAFGSWPWQHDSTGVRAFSRSLLVLLLSTIAYTVLFHPHVTQLFYPAQTFAGVPPWWASVAQTSSAYFNLGWVLMSVAVLVCVDVLWGGAPFRRLRPGPARLLAVTALSTAAGLALFFLSLRGMNAFWGEAFQGGQYTDAPYFRHLHAAELAGFFVLAAFALDTFAGPARSAGRMALWTVLAVGVTAGLHLFYYSALATRLLGKVPGYAQPEDTPLVWTLLVLALVLAQRELFARWPMRYDAVHQ